VGAGTAEEGARGYDEGRGTAPGGLNETGAPPRRVDAPAADGFVVSDESVRDRVLPATHLAGGRDDDLEGHHALGGGGVDGDVRRTDRRAVHRHHRELDPDRRAGLDLEVPEGPDDTDLALIRVDRDVRHLDRRLLVAVEDLGDLVAVLVLL